MYSFMSVITKTSEGVACTKKVKISGKITKKAKQTPARNKTMLENKTAKKPIFSSLYKPGAMKFHNSKSKYGIATNVAT